MPRRGSKPRCASERASEPCHLGAPVALAGGGVLAGVEATPVAAGGLTRSQPVASPLATPSFRRTRATQARAPTVAKPPPKMR